MSYKVFDVNSVVEYLLSVKEIVDFFNSSSLIAEEIGDGNLNYVYKVSSQDDSTKVLIVKQAVPYPQINP